MKSFIIICFSIIALQIQTSAQNLINHKGNDIFLSGINLAWMDFGNDLTNFNKVKFTEIMKDVASAGGNSVRWWIHVDGRSTPTFTSDTVTGISQIGLDNLATALDIAAENGIVVSLCLWSFDMMAKQKSGEGIFTATDRIRKNRILLENERATQAYIDNALIPMVNRVKGHTAILCWEIFNEPEGMTTIANWSEIEKVNISYIQRFTNRCAGAIHRTDSEAKVSTGSWNARATAAISTISGSKNYYSDSELITAGGDSDGILDFYMLHYYAEWNGDTYSPFHNPIEYWGLEKPLLIGEFAAHGIIKEPSKNFSPKSELTTTEAMSYLFDNGYAGGWGWTYTGHDGNGSLADMKYVLDSLKKTYPQLITIPRDPNHNYAPKNIGIIKDTVLFKNTATITDYVNANLFFEDDDKLTYSVNANGPAIISFVDDTIISISVIPDSIGISTFTITATDTGGKSISTNFNVIVREQILSSDNKLLFALSSSSSEENDTRRRVFMNDGDKNTRWSSIYNDNEWIKFDMLENFTISRIVLYWENAYADKYEIQVSTDNQNWNTVFTIGTGQKTKNNIVFSPTECRYIRINFSKRATTWGYSLYEVEAYENSGESENIAPTASATPMKVSMKINYDLAFTFQRSKFVDSNSDVLSFTATLENGDALPNWLTFNPSTLEFKGRAAFQDIDSFAVSVTGTDWFNQKDIYTILFVVKNDATNIFDNSKNQSLVYPNPVSNGEISIELDSEITAIGNLQINSALGNKILDQSIDFTKGKSNFTLANFLPGMYFISVTINNKNYTKTLIVN